MKSLIFAALLLASTSSFAASAFWTGRMEQVQTVTFRMAWSCEYNYIGHIFWRIFENTCPSSVEVY